MAYLTSIMRATARKENIALDDITLKTTVLNIRDPTQVVEHAENGAYVHGLFLQGASW